jgi:hypothetical protein
MRNPDTVTASEIGDYVFCAETWRLAQLGHESANQPQRKGGTTHHAYKATAERVAGGSIALGRILVIIALLALAALWALSR